MIKAGEAIGCYRQIIARLSPDYREERVRLASIIGSRIPAHLRWLLRRMKRAGGAMFVTSLDPLAFTSNK
jgi:hypothetical protein